MAQTNTVDIARAAGEKKDSSYIVALKDGVDKEAHLKWLRERLSEQSRIENDYSFLNSYSGIFDDETLAVIRASPDVSRIEEDAQIRLSHGAPTDVA
ncbi:hypothetical protein BD311DRAFT_762557 [Dichomitus squalens]|uniref:Inhibitor I9 domain-containing protein n=1 Tax=Dichomitus squalens TaxID=114155 RepID=A0A4Q9MG54_9APHY|nr:hypothetical protein BD311DRAFT_762557 [Dichomitus squalens]